MGNVTIPVLLILTVAAAPARAQGLADPSRIAQAIKQEIALTDTAGIVREGVVVDVGPEGVTMRLDSGIRSFAFSQIASAERLKDGRLDGVAKGLLWGVVLGLLPNQGYTSQESALGEWARAVAGFGVIGYLLDAAETNREALYRSPTSSTSTGGPALASTVALRIRF
jgi:hypothetical protein